MRLQSDEEALRPLYPEERLGRDRRFRKEPHAGVRGLLRHGQAGQGRNHPLRLGLDPAHGGRAEYPHLHPGTVAAGQHRRGGRRHQCPARRAQCAGLHGSRPAVQHPAGLYRPAPGPVADPGGVQQGQYPGHGAEKQRQLVGQPAQVLCQPAQGLVRRRSHAGKRLLLRAAAQGGSGRRLFLHVRHGQDAPRRDQGRLHFRRQPHEQLPQYQQDARGPGQSGVAGLFGTAPFGNHGQLAASRRGSQGEKDRSLFAAFGSPRGKGRHHQQQRPLAALVRQGRGTRRRGPQLRGHLRAAGQPDPRAVHGRGRHAARTAAQAELA